MNEVMTKDHLAEQAVAKGPASEATQIEQSRAIAQVQGALVVAHQAPRDAMAAMNRIREACQHGKLAERAFFSFPRAGQTVTGPSIHLATELARCWGNVDFGIVELARSDRKAESEMLAVAWDLETNTRIFNSFIVPHRRDTKRGVVDLVDMRDIYENNANQGARRLRECIFRCIPVYVREEAMAICRQTLEHGGGKPIEERREALVEAFAEIGITRKQIEKRAGQKADRLTAVDIANLGITYQSIKRGEIDKAEAFPPEHSDDLQAELTGAKQEDPKGAPTEPAPEQPAGDEATGTYTPPADGEQAKSEAEAQDDADYVNDLLQRIEECLSKADLDQLMNSQARVIATLGKPHRDAITKAQQKALKAIQEGK